MLSCTSEPWTSDQSQTLGSFQPLQAVGSCTALPPSRAEAKKSSQQGLACVSPEESTKKGGAGEEPRWDTGLTWSEILPLTPPPSPI